MRRSADFVAVNDKSELSMHGFDVAFGNAAHQRFITAAVLYKVRDRADLQAVAVHKLNQIRKARHFAIVLEYLADNGCRCQTRQLRQITSGLRVSGTHQYSAVLRHERKHMSGLDDVLWRR